MNSETAIIVAVVVAITIVLSVSLVFNGSLDQVGSSLFGENSDSGGFFQPDGNENEGYDFPTESSESSETNSPVEAVDNGKL